MKKEEKDCNHKIHFKGEFPMYFLGHVGDIGIFLCNHCDEQVIVEGYEQAL